MSKICRQTSQDSLSGEEKCNSKEFSLNHFKRRQSILQKHSIYILSYTCSLLKEKVPTSHSLYQGVVKPNINVY